MFQGRIPQTEPGPSRPRKGSGAGMLTDLKTAQKVTGAKQVTRALKNGTARRVFLAQDADPRVTEPIQALCQEQGTATESVDHHGCPGQRLRHCRGQRCGRHRGGLNLRYSPHRPRPLRIEYIPTHFLRKEEPYAYSLTSWFAKEENRPPTSPTLLPCRRV